MPKVTLHISFTNLHARRECLAKAEKHTILEGKVHVYRRNDSPIWHCSTYLKGKNWWVSTKKDSLAKAKDSLRPQYGSRAGMSL
ncbi:hypothetical protein [Mesorhizobium sp.]|uniref:hypothetical protein n=1 Tax=Mesorhizobium sp. TaxID=1871066 RepID=UPI000FE5173F|nr:hypothetical protein [Mesorhizobium sp.]RWB51148.1 MAG: hypothetical protein EOQ47_30810 [Mesorhizobium sp.]